MTRKQNFTSTKTQGEFLTAEIFDATAANANHLLASMLIGALYPNGGRSFQITPPRSMSISIAGQQKIKEYYEFATTVVAAAIDNEKANFRPSLNEYMLDQGGFGISGLHVLENDEYEFPCRFEAVDAKMMTIAEGKDGFVDTIFLETQMTVRQLVDTYGLENVSPATQKKYRDGTELESKVTLLRVIEPRIDGSKMAYGNANMPIASIHIEKDAEHVLQENGYQEMPIFVTRFWKAMGEVYGRSPAFETMPNILEINDLRESLILATEKMLDPPLLVREDGTTEGGTINTSARAINVRHVNGRIDSTGKTVEQLVTIGDLRPTMDRILVLEQRIEEDFFKDRLVDLNNETRMTAFETNVRNELRSQSLGSIYSQQINELFSRVIERVFNICLHKGLLGVIAGSQQEQDIIAAGGIPVVIPDELVKMMSQGKVMYQVEFISPAARIMRFEELKGISDTVAGVIESFQVNPEIADCINFDVVASKLQELTGAPVSILRSAEDVEKIRKTRAEQQAQAAQMQAAQMQAETAKTGAQAMESASRAQLRAL